MTSQEPPRKSRSLASLTSTTQSTGSEAEETIRLGRRTELFRGPVITLVEREVDGKPFRVVEHPGASCAVPVTPEGKIVLIRQFRPAIGDWIWEIPAGTLEPGESPDECMAREVVEEIGWEAESLESLNCILTSPGFSNQQMHLFVAHLSRHVGTRHEATEKINVHVLDWDDVRGMMERQEIRDAKSLVALYRYESHAVRVNPVTPQRNLGN